MKQNLNKRNYIFIIIFILFASIILGIMPNGMFGVSASAEPELKNSGSDISEFFDIYSQSLIGNRASVALVNGQYQIINAEENDEIVYLVPIPYFSRAGSDLVIEDDYGFYIKTENYGTQHFLATVMVFQIETFSNLEETIDRVITTVRPVFEYQYIYIPSGNGYVYIDGQQVFYNLIVSRVVPYAKISGENITYQQTSRYFLKDVSFGATLYNEQHLNVGDTGYLAYNDYGSYFTAFDYEYNGKKREYGAFPADQMYDFSSDCLGLALGVLEKTPVIGDTIETIGLIFDIVNTLQDGIEMVEGIMSFAEKQVIQTEKKITTQCYYQNRKDQLEHYTDYLGNPFLAKMAAVVCNTETNQSLWYGVGDYARAYFYIGHGDGDGVDPYFTRFVDNIALKIVDSYTDEVVTVGSGFSVASLRQPEYKTLSIDNNESVYMLPAGREYFRFKAQYASDYKIIINLPSKADVSINGKKYTGKAISVSEFISGGKDLDIIFSNNAVGLQGDILIYPNNSNIASSIAGNGYYLFRATLNGVYQLQTDNNMVKISAIYKEENGVLVKYEKYGDISEGNILSYPFDSNVYYILLHNTSSQQIINCKFSTASVETLQEEDCNRVDLNADNFNYFKITASKSSDYVLSLSNTLGNNFSFILLNSNLKQHAVNQYIDGVCIISMDANKSYYIGIKTGKNENLAEVIINKAEKSYQWKISGGDFGADGTILAERQINVTRGYTYTLSFLINGLDRGVAIFSDDSETSWGFYGITVNPNTNQIEIPSQCPIGGNGVEIKAWKSFQENLIYGHTLRLIPVGVIDLKNIYISNGDSVVLSVTAPKYVYSITYTVSVSGKSSLNGTIEIPDVEVVNESNTKTVNILPLINSLSSNESVLVTVKIVSFKYYDALKQTKVSNYAYNLTLNSLYGSTVGPYSIRCKRHLYNIRYNPQYSFKLTSNITCQDWEPIDLFEGVLDMNSCTISIINKAIKLNQNYGFIIENRGTIKAGHFLPYLVTQEGGTSNRIMSYIGTICAKNYGTIDRCFMENQSYNSPYINIKDWYFWAGGMVGINFGEIRSSANFVPMQANCVRFGGIVGTNGESDESRTPRVYSCTNYGEIIAQTRGTMSICVGGIVGLAGEGGVIEQGFNRSNILFNLNTSNYRVNVYMGQIAGRMCKADKLIDPYCTGSASVKQGVYVDNLYMADAMVGEYFNSSKSSGNCITRGELITLADGRQVPVEELTGNEMLLVWNLHKGGFDVAPILFIDSDPMRTYTVIELTFSDETKVKVISEHGFWDYDLNRYVFLDKNASQYIGHWFNKQATDENGNMISIRVQLTKVEIRQEQTVAYSPVTYGHLCYYVNGMLSMPGGTSGLFNIFEVDAETMCYDEALMMADIEQYGLFTYEEFSSQFSVSESVFDAFNGQYLKVAIGKGLITEETINNLIERYSEFFTE